MRVRSFGISASNMEEFISILKEKEAEYIEESTLSQLNYISLKEDTEDILNNEYNFLLNKSNYKIRRLNNNRKNRKNIDIFSSNFHKKIKKFHGLGRKRLNIPISGINKDKTNTFRI